MNQGLFLLCSVAGLIMVVGSLFLLWKGRIVLDHGGQQVSTIELPGGIRLSTQFPVLIMFFLGVVLLIYPPYYFGKSYHDANLCPNHALHTMQFPEMVSVTSNVRSPTPIDVYAVVGWQDKARNSVTFQLPFKKGGLYRLLYSDGHGGVIPSDPFMLDDLKPQTLRDIEIGTMAPATESGDIASVARDKMKEANFK
ncbi:MAG TPA: hypothetical protein VGO68_19235 [Pyrinomonadaceae bacterium]|nr:hypothetical protein [Pyrinomonadaceae bacterium]